MKLKPRKEASRIKVAYSLTASSCFRKYQVFSFLVLLVRCMLIAATPQEWDMV